MEAIAKLRHLRHPLFGEGVAPAKYMQVQKFRERDDDLFSDEESYWRIGKPCEENAENKEEEMDCKDDTENEETQ
eukprot:scaffold5201_cov42-Cyclotella_meneghiniana.AAC.7